MLSSTNLAPQLQQIACFVTPYINICLSLTALTPSLYDMATIGKQIGKDTGVRISSKFLVFLPEVWQTPTPK